MATYELYRVVTGNDPDAHEYYEQVACNGRVMWSREIVQRLNTLDAVCDQAAKEIQEQQEEIERLRAELTDVWQRVDDVLFDPALKLVDAETGEPVRGDDLYLWDGPVQAAHVPALREWFVGVQKREPWLSRSGGEEE